MWSRFLICISFLQGPRGERKGKSLRCDAEAEHSKVNPMPLQNPFGEEIFTFPPICPLPLAKGGACNLTQIGWLETTSYIIFSACKLRSKGKGDRTGANLDRFQVPPVGEIDED